MNGTVIQGKLVILIVILICSPYSKRLSRILALALRFRLYRDTEAWMIKPEIAS